MGLDTAIEMNPFLRKARNTLRKVPRATRRILANADAYATSPPIVANSFPKSGTHLLLQILSAIPGARDYGSFIASMPSVPHRLRSDRQLTRMIRALAPGELSGAHLFATRAAAEALSAVQAAHFFVYRDPRDVVVSEAHYLTEMNRLHSLHKPFAALGDYSDRYMLSICGGGDGFPCDYPDIGSRFQMYRPWVDDESVCAVSFESLVSERRNSEFVRIATHYNRFATAPIDPDSFARAAESTIAPERSRTFRAGQTGGWRDAFESRHIDAFKKHAGQLLVDLGYESSLDWTRDPRQ